MIPSNADLEYFLKICETLNVSRASEVLGLAQSTLSQSLKRLEDMVGTQLFIRRKNGLELTRAGESLQVHVKGYADNWKLILDEVRGVETTPRGYYSIGSHTSVATYR